MMCIWISAEIWLKYMCDFNSVWGDFDFLFQGDLKELNLENVIFFGGFAGHYNPDSGCSQAFQGAIQRVRFKKKPMET